MKIKNWHIALALVTLFIFAVACENKDPKADNSNTSTEVAKAEELADIDLERILERGKIVLLTENSSTSYYVYRGQPMGYDYELIRSFAKHLGVDLEVKVIEDLNDMFRMLNEGEGDLIACNLTVTAPRKEFISFTSPLTQTRQVLVQHVPHDYLSMSDEAQDSVIVKNPIDLGGKEVYVHKFSSYYSRLQSLENEIGKDIDIVEVSGAIYPEQLIRLVSDGEVPRTVSDENIAELNQTYFDNLHIKTAISFPQEIAWAVRPNAPDLLKTLNKWIDAPENQRQLAYTYRKYFKMTKSQKLRATSEFSSLSGKQISHYDEKLKLESKKIGWDWRLLAAMIYRESRFNPQARSWVGAFGLMQLMPATARRFGIDTTHTGFSNIEAGVKYIQYLDAFWEDRITDKDERIKFILASYNVGPGHVLDAQAIARQRGLNDKVWFGNVAECILLKSDPLVYKKDYVKYGYCRGKEPYDYVKHILANYNHYKSLD
ncbi:MltF family protein [Halocola ammonii]